MPLAYRTVAHFFVAAMLIGAVAPASAQARTLRIAAAADLTPVLPAVSEAYEHKTGVHLIASFGSSSTLADQLRNGAPFDVFLSADTQHPQQLIDAGLTRNGKPEIYAHGTLVLWARKDSPAQPLSVASLEKPAVTRIAIANPAHAPYGLAAQQFLTHEHLAERLQAKLVVAENIAQTAQFAQTGNAQVGFLSLTTANTPHFREQGSFVTLPAGSYAPIAQAGVVLKSSARAIDADAFLRWLCGPEGQATLSAHGLSPAK